jgi:hypothetical protein
MTYKPAFNEWTTTTIRGDAGAAIDVLVAPESFSVERVRHRLVGERAPTRLGLKTMREQTREEGFVGWLRLHGRWAAAIDRRVCGDDIRRRRREGYTPVVSRGAF